MNIHSELFGFGWLLCKYINIGDSLSSLLIPCKRGSAPLTPVSHSKPHTPQHRFKKQKNLFLSKQHNTVPAKLNSKPKKTKKKKRRSKIKEKEKDAKHRNNIKTKKKKKTKAKKKLLKSKTVTIKELMPHKMFESLTQNVLIYSLRKSNIAWWICEYITSMINWIGGNGFNWSC